MIRSKTGDVDRGLTLEERRAFMQLSLEERRRQMARQAALMAKHYNSPAAAKQRETWQGGDIVECD